MRDIQNFVVLLNESLDPAKFHRDVLGSSMKNRVTNGIDGGLSIHAKTSRLGLRQTNLGEKICGQLLF